jgi:hypothetical protein
MAELKRRAEAVVSPSTTGQYSGLSPRAGCGPERVSKRQGSANTVEGLCERVLAVPLPP